ncbi:MAG: Hsp20/alpha crystallin family protein [bacterium]
MSIIKWNPFTGPSVIEDFDKFFDSSMPMSQTFVPAMDVYQDKDNVYVEAPLAGIDPEKVDISIENDVLTVKGENEKKTEIEEKNYYRKEVRRGSFYRSIQLPARVAGDSAEANYEKGVLTITIPKADEAKPKMIKIKANKK